VSSFLSTWSHQTPQHSGHSPSSSAEGAPLPEAAQLVNSKQAPPASGTPTNLSSVALAQDNFSPRDSPTPPRNRTTSGSRPSSRPGSMVQTYQPPLMEVANDTPPELQPVFTFLNSHSNKLYQEGYFLKLHDLDARGRPSVDRTWQECFAVRRPCSLSEHARLTEVATGGHRPLRVGCW
jgi:CCR4-NOT transcriptional complex subunit CAF120